MKKKLTYIVLGSLAVLIVAFFIYSALATPFHINTSKRAGVSLNKSEQKWAADKKVLKLKPGRGLEYLCGSDGDFYLSITKAFDGSGLKIRFVDRGEDARVVNVGNVNRESLLEQGQLTKPFYKVTGTLFRRAGETDERIAGKGTVTAAAVKGDMTKKELNDLQYNGRKIHVILTGDAESAVGMAMKKKTDFIIADTGAVTKALKDMGIADRYLATEHNVFSSNVCLLVPKSKNTLYTVVDAYANESFSAGNKFSDSMVLLVIIFISVFGAFLIYFITTQNLYDELTTRMKQLRESKSEMETTFNGAPLYMAEITPEGDLINVNKKMIEELKAPRTEVIGKNVGDLMSFTLENMWKLNGTIKMVSETGEGRNLLITDNKRIMDIDIYPIGPETRKDRKLLFMAADVTEVKMAERQMLQHNKMIAVGQLASGVAHEIRNPLGIIRNHCYILKNTENEELRKESVAVIEKSVERSGKIITNLLNFSRQSEMNVEDVMIREHIKEVISLNEGMLKKKQIKLEFSTENDFQVRLCVESLDMILINLLSNSVDAINEQGTISIELERKGYFFVIVFSDTGCGMDDDTIKAAFNPFFTTKTGQQGNGLGLYIVYNEIGKMDGDIRIESVPGQGTTFRIKLPAKGENK